LVFEEEGGEGDGEDEAEVFGFVGGEHAEGDEVHDLE
jgi:hypothetical protein